MNKYNATTFSTRVLTLIVVLFVILSLLNFYSETQLEAVVQEMKSKADSNNGVVSVSNGQTDDDLKKLLILQQNQLNALDSEVQTIKYKELEDIKLKIKDLNQNLQQIKDSVGKGSNLISDRLDSIPKLKKINPPNLEKIIPPKENKQQEQNKDNIDYNLLQPVIMDKPFQVVVKDDVDPYSRIFEFPEKRYAKKMFVSIASFTDEICPHTLEELFRTAKNPDDIYIGLIQQNLETTTDCLEKYCEISKEKCRRSQIRSIKFAAMRATGVMPARYLATTLYCGEEYFFQIDAHTRFGKYWDSRLLNNLLQIKYDRAVMTTHPIATSYYDENEIDNMVNLCVYKWDPTKLPRFSGQLISKRTNRIREPTPGVFIGGGCVLARAEFLKDCPFDPNYIYLFSGEELLFSICLYTHGWDIYNPTATAIFHYYDDPRRKVIRPPAHDKKRDDAQKRLLHVLEVEKIDPKDPLLFEVEKYAMGNFRSVQDYWKYAKIDWEKRDSDLSWCSMPKKREIATQHITNDKKYPDNLPRLPTL